MAATLTLTLHQEAHIVLGARQVVKRLGTALGGDGLIALELGQGRFVQGRQVEALDPVDFERRRQDERGRRTDGVGAEVGPADGAHQEF
jgi:hypothetical protein